MTYPRKLLDIDFSILAFFSPSLIHRNSWKEWVFSELHMQDPA